MPSFPHGKLFDIPQEKIQRNPMVIKVGLYGHSKKCKTCKHLIYHERNRRWYKCLHRGLSRGPGTDHGCTWDACKLYKEED